VKVNLRQKSLFRRPGAPVAALVFLSIVAGTGTAVLAQTANPSSAANPFWGSVTAQPVSDATLKLSLDDAVRRGFENNLGLKEAENGQKTLEGEKNQALQMFLPTITFTGDTGYYQHNLVALGFNPALISKFAPLFPGGKLPAGFSAITRDDLTEAQLHLDQTLFSGPVIAGWKAAGAAERAAYFAKMTARGEVVQQVATIYLRSIADGSNVENAQSQVAEAKVQLDHAHQAHEAGTAANLDELRARVELQAQQQSLIGAQNQLEEVLAIALKDRQDYQNLQNQAVEFKAVHAAYRSQRLPTLKFSSYYGTSTVDGAGTRGNFAAFGALSFPIFREAGLRGDEDASRAQMQAVNAQLDDLRTHIDEQVRSALLDVAANTKLVEVARSNVELATRALSDETDRVNAGVDDNLPLVTAQAELASAQSNLVQSLYQYNVSKLALARSCGVLEQQYREYLGR
jgi:outer membrane protein TolC